MGKTDFALQRLVLRMFEKKGLNLKMRTQGLWYDVVVGLRFWLPVSTIGFPFEIMTSSSSATKKGRKSRAKVRRRPVKEASLRRWVRAARRRGVAGPGLVYELHVRRGLPLPEVAVMLRASLREVRRYWRQHRAECAGVAQAAKPPRILLPLPRSKEDVVALRERVGLALWETVVEAFGEGPGTSESGDGAAPEPPSMALVSVRLKALRQMSRLYGVSAKRRGKSGGRAAEVGQEVCATPEEIAGLVREWRWSRGGQV